MNALDAVLAEHAAVVLARLAAADDPAPDADAPARDEEAAA